MADSSKSTEGTSQEPPTSPTSNEVASSSSSPSVSPTGFRPGKGKGMLLPPSLDEQPLRGQIRQPRSGSEDETDSSGDDETSTSDRDEVDSQEECPTSGEKETNVNIEKGEESEEVEPPPKKRKTRAASSPKVSRPPPKKKEVAYVEPRDGHPSDEHFQESARVISKADVMSPEFLDYFYEALVPEEHRGEFPREKVRLRFPDVDDRAHDPEKGVTIFWKMPGCGFRLKLSTFVRDLLRGLDLAPGQILPAGWCYISSFEEMFKQFHAHFGNERPTAPVFWEFYSTLWSSGSYTAIRRITSSTCLFDTDRVKWNKFEEWNQGWVYLENPEDFDCWNGVRREWRPLEKKAKKKKVSTESSTSLDLTDKHRVILITDFVNS